MVDQNRRKYKTLFCSIFAHKLSQLDSSYLDSKLSQVAWVFFESIEELEVEQFLEILRCYEESAILAKEKLKVNNEQIYVKEKKKSQ